MTETQKMRDELHRIKAQEDRALRQQQMKQQREEYIKEQLEQIEEDDIYEETDKGKVTTWDKVIANAKSCTASFTSIHNWASSMADLIEMCKNLNQACANSFRKLALLYLKTPARQALIYPLSDFIRETFTSERAIDDLPQLQHLVSMNDNNELAIEPLIRSDGLSEMGTLNDLFKAGIEHWLNEAGYHRDPDNNKRYIDPHGAVLTKEEFDDLKEVGLASFLAQEHSGVRFSPR